MKIWGSITELVKVVFRSGNRETKLDSAPQTGSQHDVTFRLPDLVNNTGSPVIATIVEKDLAQVLTNKTIDGDLNTLQDVGIASLKTVLGDANKALVRDAAGVVTSAKISNDNVADAAGIVDTKLATISTAGKVSGNAVTSGTIGGSTAVNTTGTVTASLFSGPLTGNVSGTATNVTDIVAKANGGTGADNTAVTFPTTGTLVTRDATETLLNKTTVSSTGLVTGAFTLPAGTEAQRPAPTAGMVRYNTDSSSFEGYASGTWSGIGGGGTTDRFTQASPVLSVGDVVYLNGSIYTKALATAVNTAEVVGVISRGPGSLGTNTYEVTLSGEVTGLTGLVAGDVYFLSAATTGLATNVEPAVIGQVSVPIGVASSTTTMYVAPKRGVVLGGTNARTQLNLVSAAVTQIFDAVIPSLYQAGELTGWVQLGTSQKFYFRAPFAQNGAGTNWNISPSYVGDTPPVGFSITMASNGKISVTCPTFTGTGLVNYALNAPAVGATFPLDISAARITQDTIAAARLPVASATTDGVVNQVAQEVIGEKTLISSATNFKISSASTSKLIVAPVNHSQSVPSTIYTNGDNSSLLLKAGESGGVWSAVSIVGNWNGSSATGGKIGLSTAAAERFFINSAGEKVFTTGAIIALSSAIGPGAGTYPVKWNSSSGIFTYDSSTRLVKENIVDCPYGLQSLMNLTPRKYFRTDDQREEIGFVADEVENVIPEAVCYVEKRLFTKDEADTEIIPGGVHYEKLTAVLVKAIQELKQELDAAKVEIEALKDK